MCVSIMSKSPTRSSCTLVQQGTVLATDGGPNNGNISSSDSFLTLPGCLKKVCVTIYCHPKVREPQYLNSIQIGSPVHCCHLWMFSVAGTDPISAQCLNMSVLNLSWVWFPNIGIISSQHSHYIRIIPCFMSSLFLKIRNRFVILLLLYNHGPTWSSELT